MAGGRRLLLLSLLIFFLLACLVLPIGGLLLILYSFAKIVNDPCRLVMLHRDGSVNHRFRSTRRNHSCFLGRPFVASVVRFGLAFACLWVFCGSSGRSLSLFLLRFGFLALPFLGAPRLKMYFCFARGPLVGSPSLHCCFSLHFFLVGTLSLTISFSGALTFFNIFVVSE